jgi:hypothetical protein
LTVAERRGEKEIPCVYVDVTADEERLILASIDAIGALAVPDREKLSELIQSVETEDESILALLAQCAEPMPKFDEEKPPRDAKVITCPSCGEVIEV